jgi:DnaJ-domain-containing protein 1
LAVPLYAIGLVVVLFALARENPVVGASMLVLAGTAGDIRVSRKGTSKIGLKPKLLRRTLCRLGAQIIVLTFVILDIGSLGFALLSPVWLAPWAIINVAALVLGSLSWSEDRRIRKEGATAAERQVEKIRAERQSVEERQREAQRQQEAECLREAELLREAERRRREEEEREKQRRQQAERLRQAEEQIRDAERRRQEAEREAQRVRQEARKRVGARLQRDWWNVLGVPPSASKDDIVRNYRRSIKKCHPDRVAGLAPEFLQLAEEHTKALNEAYENAIRCRG